MELWLPDIVTSSLNDELRRHPALPAVENRIKMVPESAHHCWQPRILFLCFLYAFCHSTKAPAPGEYCFCLSSHLHTNCSAADVAPRLLCVVVAKAHFPNPNFTGSNRRTRSSGGFFSSSSLVSFLLLAAFDVVFVMLHLGREDRGKSPSSLRSFTDNESF